MYTVFDVVMR